jgi:hypothetical protein
MMVDNYGVCEENWRDALLPHRGGNRPTAPPELAPNFSITISREGEHLFEQATNEAKLKSFRRVTTITS